MNDMPFGLSHQSTYAKLSPSDLDSMGKRASLCFLEDDIPLNDSVVKLAKEHPSISPHQVRRVVEAANNHTYAEIFEKQAGNKNIDFEVCNPNAVLKSLDDGSRPGVITTCHDYGSDPVKQSHVDIEHDQVLMRAFGFDPATPGSEATVVADMRKEADGKLVIERIMSTKPPDSETAIDRILKTAMGPIAMAPPQQGQPAQTDQQHPEVTHRSNMRALEQRVELEKKKQELIAMQAKGMQAQGDMGGAPAPTAGGPPGTPPPQEGGMPPPEGGAQTEGAPPEGAIPPEGAMPMAPPPGPPGPQPGLPGGAPFPMEEQRKMGSVLTKQAMDYVKSGRPQSAMVMEDLRKGVSLRKIKEAAAKDPHRYELDNPHG
jgi:hypothetical protein